MNNNPNFDVESISSLLVLYCGLDNGHWPVSRGLAGPIILYNRVALFYSKLSVFLGIYISFLFWSPICLYHRLCRHVVFTAKNFNVAYGD